MADDDLDKFLAEIESSKRDPPKSYKPDDAARGRSRGGGGRGDGGSGRGRERGGKGEGDRGRGRGSDRGGRASDRGGRGANRGSDRGGRGRGKDEGRYDEEEDLGDELQLLKDEIAREKTKSKLSSEAKKNEELEALKLELARLKLDAAKAEKPKPKEKPSDEVEKMREELARMKAELESKKTDSKMSESRRREEELKKEVEELRKKADGSATKKTETESGTLSRIEELKALKRDLEKKKKDLEEAPSASASSSDTVARIKDLDREKESLARKLKDLPSTSALESKRSTARTALDRVQYGIDLLFLMDCTGSMGSFIQAAKLKMMEIIKEVCSIENKAIMRIAFVGYRDYCDGNRQYEVVDFVDSNLLGPIQEKLANCPATGGGDGPEDIAGALNIATTLAWNSSTRLLVHFADAPCHGKQYHSMADDYPSGDPKGLVPEELLKKLIQKRVDYYFMKINNYTDLMETIFQQTFEAMGKEMFINRIDASAADFVPKVVHSISSSMVRSAAFSKRF